MPQHWTPEEFWEYVSGYFGEFERDEMRRVLSERGLSVGSAQGSNKRPVAFRVALPGHYFVTTSEDEARAIADTEGAEYEGLYLVGDRNPNYGDTNAAHSLGCLTPAEIEGIAKLGVQEIADAWGILEGHGFPPEAVNWPQENIGGKLPVAIDNAFTALIGARDDLLAEAIRLRDQVEGARNSETIPVPKAALDWLFGEGKDSDGWGFGECRTAQLALNAKNPRRYWWRSKFRAMIPALRLSNTSTVLGPVEGSK